LSSPCLDDETLAGYADGSLGAHGRAAVDEHVDRCHACRRLLAAVGAATEVGENRADLVEAEQTGEG
jgi:anti-sigma factor RsiW